MRNKLSEYFIDPILDLLPVKMKDNLFALKKFHQLKRIHPNDPDLLIQNVNSGAIFGGMTDRFKGIISAYCYCLCTDRNFKINHTWPYKLEDYLSPNEYDWVIGAQDQISKNYYEVLYFPVGGSDVSRNKILHQKKVHKQLHAFFGGHDYVELFNQHFHKKYVWEDLFQILFKPNKRLEEAIDQKTAIINGPYTAIVFRFQNLLGDFQEYHFRTLPPKEKELLIDRCIDKLLNVQKQLVNPKILVTSDSVYFLKKISGLKNIYTFPEKIVHIDNTGNQPYEVYQKSFVDFFMLSKAEKVYTIETGEMYHSDFPRFAAKIGKIPFERIQF